MMEYNFYLLGLRVKLYTPNPIQISERFQPFTCPPFQGEADCTIRIAYTPLLQMTENGYWYGLEYYCNTVDEKRIFHCKKRFGTPFAATQIGKNGDIRISVCPEYTQSFSDMSGILNYIGFENLLLQHCGLLLHASLIEYDHQGIAFTGPSGVGKSTQADIWQRCFGAKILNGDRTALRHTENGWVAYGSPYAGTSGIYCNENTPISALVVLKQGKENKLQRLSGMQAFYHIWPELSVRRQDGDFVAEATELCTQLLRDIPVYLLECLPETTAATVLKEGLSL